MEGTGYGWRRAVAGLQGPYRGFDAFGSFGPIGVGREHYGRAYTDGDRIRADENSSPRPALVDKEHRDHRYAALYRQESDAALKGFHLFTDVLYSLWKYTYAPFTVEEAAHVLQARTYGRVPG